MKIKSQNPILVSGLAFVCLAIVFVGSILTACEAKTAGSEQAREALVSFFDELARGRYDAAAKWYAGSYETLLGFNPQVNPDDHIALWRNGCQVNGLQCLTIRIFTFNELNSSGEYIFTVEFNTLEGELFVLPACCGQDPTAPPQFQFEYRVVQDGYGEFRVLDLPVYMP